MDFATMEKLPRLPIYEVKAYLGAKIALFENNVAYTGWLQMIATDTLGHKRLGIRRVRVVKRKGAELNIGPLILLDHRTPYGRRNGFAVLEAAPISIDMEWNE